MNETIIAILASIGLATILLLSIYFVGVALESDCDTLNRIFAAITALILFVVFLVTTFFAVAQ